MRHKHFVRIILICTFAMPLLVVAMMEISAQRHTGQRVPSLQDMLVGGTQALQVTKAAGSWKYKSEAVDDSQQGCVIGGSCPTAGKA